MNEVTTLSGTEPREILQTLIEKKVAAVMSYLSKGKWHVAKVLLTNLGANRLDVQPSPREIGSILQKTHEGPRLARTQTETTKPPPINIQVNQPVGISLKCGYGKLVFETTVIALEPSSEPANSGTIALMVPDRIEAIQRRSYFRVDVPGSLKVNVMLWCCRRTDDGSETQQAATPPPPHTCWRSPEHYWQGKLTDISAGGAQVIVDIEQKPALKRGQFVGLRFTPMPYEMPLMFDAQIRNILPTTDEKSICLGLRIVGLEASPEGRQVLQRLCSVVEHYYQINQYSDKQ
ncbi:MAG: PilZ domain-containing protein [Sedimentisphaerales bacterium]